MVRRPTTARSIAYIPLTSEHTGRPPIKPNTAVMTSRIGLVFAARDFIFALDMSLVTAVCFLGTRCAVF